MANYGAALISLSHDRHGCGGKDLSPTSDNESSDHSGPRAKPHRRAAPSSPPAASPSAEAPKNKLKPSIVITSDVSDGAAMCPVVLEIAAGSDVVESVVQFTRRRRGGITLLSGSESVSNVTLSLHGPFSLLSLYDSFLSIIF